MLGGAARHVDTRKQLVSYHSYHGQSGKKPPAESWWIQAVVRNKLVPVLQVPHWLSCIQIISFTHSLYRSKPHIYNSSLMYCFPLLLCGAPEKLAAGWYSVQLLCPTVSGACSGRGILQVRAGVRGFARSIAPSRLSPHWARLSDPLPLRLLMPETIPDYWYLWNEQSNLLSHFCFYIRFLMLLWLKFWETSSVILALFFACFAALFGGRQESGHRVGGGCGCVLQGDGGQCLSFDHGQAASIWVPWCQGHFASLLSASDVKSDTGDMSARLETWTRMG